MVTGVTSGIRISVKTRYEEKFSSPANRMFLFSYEIKIENTNPFDVQLLRRTWYITDALGQNREVMGEGVIGKQPIISAGDTYSYHSSCDFPTEIGRMMGSYQMQNCETGDLFTVSIPEFIMIAPTRLN